jgi:hypothetical protein
MLEAGELLEMSERQFRRYGIGSRRKARRACSTGGWASRR